MRRWRATKRPQNGFLAEWQREKTALAMRLAKARLRGKFVIGGWISLFERFQYLRGTEELYCDLALDEPDMYRMMALVMDFMRAYVDAWLEMDIDAVAFGDDWGTQISLLISPELWKRIFKPMYRELIDRVKQAGKKVFFHSDRLYFRPVPGVYRPGGRRAQQPALVHGRGKGGPGVCR